MLLEHYIRREDCGYAGFGKRLQPAMSRGDVWNLAHGVRGVSMGRAQKIVEATGGEVSLADLTEPFGDDFTMPEFVASNDTGASRARAVGAG